MFEETFAQGTSIVHRLDPRVKAVAAFAFAVLTTAADRPAALAPAVGLSIALALLARLPARAVAGRLIVINGFALLLWLTLPFTYPGEPVFHVGPLTASREGIAQAFLITVKSNAIVLAGIALLSTTYLTDMGRALSRLGVPDKLVQVLLFMLRYLGEAWREYQQMGAAMKLRAFRPRNTLHTYRSYANMIGMLLVNSYSRAEAVYAAMLCRGFDGKFHSIDDFKIVRRDVYFSLAMTASLSIIAFLQWVRIQ